MTTQEIAKYLGISRDTAYKLVSFLEDMHYIEVVGRRPQPDGRGKPSKEFALPDSCIPNLCSLLEKLPKQPALAAAVG